MRRQGSVSIACLILAVAAGVLLRLWPSLHPPGTRFVADSAAIARLALDSARLGHLPAVDSLSEAPAGRPLGPALAPGLIVSAGMFHRLLTAIDGSHVDGHLVLFGALCGGLIAIPVFLWARLAWGPGWAAPFAALAIVVLPAHLHRTFGYFLRYDAAGSLLVTSHLAALAASLAAGDARSRRIWAGIAGLLLVASLWLWRVPLMLPLIEAGFFALLLLGRGAVPEEREPFSIVVAVATPALFALEYLRAQGFAFSFSWLAVVAVAVVPWIPRLVAGRARRVERALWLGGVLLLALVLSRLASGPATYAAAAGLLPLKLRLLFHLPIAPTPAESLLLSIEELGVLPPLDLLIGPGNLAAFGPWWIAAPVLAWLFLGRPGMRALAGARADRLLLLVVTLALLVLTLLLSRTKVLLAPLAVVAIAGLVPWLTVRAGHSQPAARGARAGGARRTSGGTALRGFLAVLLAGSLLGNAIVAGALAASRTSQPDPDFLAACDWLNVHVPAGRAVVTVWENGYEVQTYAHRPTLTDAFLESDVVRERVQTVARLFLQREPDSLAAWCRAQGATHLLVPPSTQLLAVALMGNDPIVAKLRASQPLTPAEADRVLIRMMVFGREEPGFTKVFDRGLWRVYAIADNGSGP